MNTHNMNFTSLAAPTDEDYAQFDNWSEGSWFISEWEFPVVPPGHWLHDLAPVADPDLKPVLVKMRTVMGEPLYLVCPGDALVSEHEFKGDAFRSARAHARLRYGQAVRKYKPNLIAAEARGEYERRRAEEATQSGVQALLGILMDHPEILDSYRDTATPL